jgi:hypothetical protein
MSEGKAMQIQTDAQQRIRNLAIQLAVELRPHAFNEGEALEVVRCLGDLVKWQYESHLREVV